MGKISLCIFLMLVPMGGALEGTDRVVSGAQPTETCPDTARIPDHPAILTASHWALTRENKGTASTAVTTGNTTAPVKPTGNAAFIICISVLGTFWFIIVVWYCYHMISPLMRSYPLRSRLATMPADVSLTSSDEEEEGVDGFHSFSSDQAEAPDVSSLRSYQAEALADVHVYPFRPYQAEALADVHPLRSYQAEVLADVHPLRSYRAEALADVPLLHSYQPKALADDPSLRSYQAEALEVVHCLRSCQEEAPEDALSTSGLVSTNWREPKVTGHASPERPNDPVVSSPADDVLD